jgi:outer membrane lipoprotein SlyB
MNTFASRFARQSLVALAVAGLTIAVPGAPAVAAGSSSSKTCADCGVIEDIRTVEQEGDASGIGAVAGGVAGGLLGHQVGEGRGKDVATIAGVAGGAYAGHTIEKKMKKTKHYEITVRMHDGSSRVVSQSEEPRFAIGDPVKVVDGQLQPR